jgi:hypothetical protein
VNLRTGAALLLFAAWTLSQYVLISSSPILIRPALAAMHMPAGTLIAWGGLVALPASLLLARPRWLGSVSSRAMLAALILAGAWGFVCYGLADNWSFNFGAQAGGFRGSVAAGRLFWWYSLGAWALPLLVAWGAATYRLFSALRR